MGKISLLSAQSAVNESKVDLLGLIELSAARGNNSAPYCAGYDTALCSLDAGAGVEEETGVDTVLILEEHGVFDNLSRSTPLMGVTAKHGICPQSLVGSRLLVVCRADRS